MGRLAGWEFFVQRWTMFAEAVSGAMAVAKQTVPQVDQLQAVKLEIVLKKATRARQILQQLQEYVVRQEQLELKYRPVVQQLPHIQQQLRAEELSQAAEFALSEGMRQPIMQQLTGNTSAAVSTAPVSDPYGIRVAFKAGHPLALLTWRQYMAIVTRMSRTVEQQLQGPALEALADFNRERRLLVKELQALKQQLEDEVQIPQLQPLRDDTERLDQLLEALQHLQNAHMQMLQKDMRQMDLELLGLKLQLRMGDEYKGSPLESALKRLRSLHKLVEDGKRLPSAAWVQLDEDLKLVVSSVQQQQKLEQQLDVNIQKYEQMMFKRLARWDKQGEVGVWKHLHMN